MYLIDKCLVDSHLVDSCMSWSICLVDSCFLTDTLLTDVFVTGAFLTQVLSTAVLLTDVLRAIRATSNKACKGQEYTRVFCPRNSSSTNSYLSWPDKELLVGSGFQLRPNLCIFLNSVVICLWFLLYGRYQDQLDKPWSHVLNLTCSLTCSSCGCWAFGAITNHKSCKGIRCHPASRTHLKPCDIYVLNGGLSLIVSSTIP